MKQYLSQFYWYIVLYAFWIVLFERSDWQFLALSLLFIPAVVWLSEELFLGVPLAKAYPIDLLLLFSYTFKLLIEIYKAGYNVIKAIISGKVDPQIFTIKTSLKSAMMQSILANSITLTPGTVTIDMQGQQLDVLWLTPTTKHSDRAGDIIKGKFETHLMRGEQC